MVILVENGPHDAQALKIFPEAEPATIEREVPARVDFAIGSIPFIHKVLGALGIPIPEPDHYPAALEPFLGRAIVRHASRDDVLDYVRQHGAAFVKSENDFKGADTRVVHDVFDLVYVSRDKRYTISPVVEFREECRVYLEQRRIVGVHSYRPRMGEVPREIDMDVVRRAAALSPPTCALDFGVTAAGTTVLVEHNDAYSLGNYGLPPEVYYALLQTRWQEMVNVFDSVRSNTTNFA